MQVMQFAYTFQTFIHSLLSTVSHVAMVYILIPYLFNINIAIIILTSMSRLQSIFFRPELLVSVSFNLLLWTDIEASNLHNCYVCVYHSYKYEVALFA